MSGGGGGALIEVPKRERIETVDGFWLAGLILWFAISIFAIYLANGELFARLGACLIALTGVYYALMPQLEPYPRHSVSINENFALRLNSLNRDLEVQRQVVATLASSTTALLRDRALSVPSIIENRASSFEAINNDEISESVWHEEDRKVTAGALNLHLASSKISKLKASMTRVQAVFLSIGTLQWGFGDLVGV